MRLGFLAIYVMKVSSMTLTDPKPVGRDASFRNLAQRIHNDERGAVSIETILIIAAIALPILIFIIKFGWPRIKNFFNEGMNELEGGAIDATRDD